MNTYENIMTHTGNMIENIREYATEEVLSKLERMKRDFGKKVEDLNREGRKLNIGVIGRVKAGKSSFLNTLLFDGKEVLPKAATPKTATLTKMEYSEVNRIEIDFYSEEEWKLIEDDVRYGDGDIRKAARELLEMVKVRNLNIQELFQKGKEERTFESYEALVQYLNEYIGENGQYTPLVRCVYIFMDKEELKDISIVDTPGLNDTVSSRSQKTTEFIGFCDVVFFLSRAGQFLANEDLELLCNQLPQQGVKKMILVASQYDGALRDELKTKNEAEAAAAFFGETVDDTSTTVQEAQEKMEKSLISRAKNEISKMSEDTERWKSEIVARVLEECKVPVFVSSRFHDLVTKSAEEYSAEEKETYDFWKQHIDETEEKEQFRKLGNFDTVYRLYEEIKSEKERLFTEKQKELIPTFYSELYQYLVEQKEKIACKLEILKSGDKENIALQKSAMEAKIHKITSDIAEMFGSVYEELKLEKASAVGKLREGRKEASKLEVHTGTEHHTGSYTSYKVNIGPIKLGGKTEHYSYTTTYKYLSAGDALEQIRAYGLDAASEIEATFVKVVGFQKFRKKLMDIVLDNFDAGDVDFNVDYFRSVVREAIDRIDYPVVEINVSDELALISAKFTGEVRDNREQDKFRELLIDVIDKLYEGILNKVETIVDSFRTSMELIKAQVKQDILQSVSTEFEGIQQAFEQKEEEIRLCEGYLAALERTTKECEDKGRG